MAESRSPDFSGAAKLILQGAASPMGCMLAFRTTNHVSRLGFSYIAADRDDIAYLHAKTDDIRSPMSYHCFAHYEAQFSSIKTHIAIKFLEEFAGNAGLLQSAVLREITGSLGLVRSEGFVGFEQGVATVQRPSSSAWQPLWARIVETCNVFNMPKAKIDSEIVRRFLLRLADSVHRHQI